MKFELAYEKGISNQGNCIKIMEVMEWASRGEAITVGFLGGSITQGCLATKPELCYAALVYEWWKKTFPQAKIQYINAGIGATDSQFGCARVSEDLLQYAPDFVILEYSVNDCNDEHYLECYEGLVRKIIKDQKKPALMLVHNVFYDSGENAEDMHGRVAKHYELPSVSMKTSIYPEVALGKIQNRDMTPDDLHPNDLGHEMVASVITYRLDQIWRECEKLGKEEKADRNQAGNGNRYGSENLNGNKNQYGNRNKQEDEKIPSPITANAYENSVRFWNKNITPVMEGFVPDETRQEHITDIFKNGWMASKLGDMITFEVKGSCIAVQYRKTMQLPAPIARLTIDGDEEKSVLLDANFDETWGDKLVLDTVLEHGANRMHTVAIELVETHEDDKLPFYLVSVIGSSS